MTAAPQSKRIITAIKYTVAAAIIAVMVRIVVNNAADLQQSEFEVKPAFIALAVLFLAFYYVALASVWYVITAMFNVTLPYATTVRIWLQAMAGKYLPGKVWVVAGRLFFYQEKGHSPTVVGAAAAVEGAIQMATSCIVFMLCFLVPPTFEFDIASLSPIHPLLICTMVIAVLLFLIRPKPLQACLNHVQRLRKREPIELPIKAASIYTAMALCIATRAVGGLGFFFLLKGLWTVSWQDYFFLTGTMALSGLLGTLAVFTPGGLGVREASVAFLLRPFAPDGVAVMIALAARIWMVVTDLLVFGGVTGLHMLSQRGQQDER